MEIILKYFPQLAEEQIAQFAQLQSLYEEWNEQINVISRKDIDSLYEKHVLHSLSIAKVFQIDDNLKVVDIGTGGGFPGIPLAILFPNAHFTLCDSIGKKIKVVQAVIDALGLKNAVAVQSRVENLPLNSFNLAVTRAVASLDKLAEWSKRALDPQQNQGLICLKGGDLKQEIKASGVKVKTWNIPHFFKEDFFETKVIVWAKV